MRDDFFRFIYLFSLQKQYNENKIEIERNCEMNMKDISTMSAVYFAHF